MSAYTQTLPHRGQALESLDRTRLGDLAIAFWSDRRDARPLHVVGLDALLVNPFASEPMPPRMFSFDKLVEHCAPHLRRSAGQRSLRLHVHTHAVTGTFDDDGTFCSALQAIQLSHGTVPAPRGSQRRIPSVHVELVPADDAAPGGGPGVCEAFPRGSNDCRVVIRASDQDDRSLPLLLSTDDTPFSQSSWQGVVANNDYRAAIRLLTGHRLWGPDVGVWECSALGYSCVVWDDATWTAWHSHIGYQMCALPCWVWGQQIPMSFRLHAEIPAGGVLGDVRGELSLSSSPPRPSSSPPRPSSSPPRPSSSSTRQPSRERSPAGDPTWHEPPMDYSQRPREDAPITWIEPSLFTDPLPIPRNEPPRDEPPRDEPPEYYHDFGPGWQMAKKYHYIAPDAQLLRPVDPDTLADDAGPGDAVMSRLRGRNATPSFDALAKVLCTTTDALEAGFSLPGMKDDFRLRPYQLAALGRALEIATRPPPSDDESSSTLRGMLLADEMGLGKTVQCLTIILFARLCILAKYHCAQYPEHHLPHDDQTSTQCPLQNPVGIECPCVAGSLTRKYLQTLSYGPALIVASAKLRDVWIKEATAMFVRRLIVPVPGGLYMAFPTFSLLTYNSQGRLALSDLYISRRDSAFRYKYTSPSVDKLKSRGVFHPVFEPLKLGGEGQDHGWESPRLAHPLGDYKGNENTNHVWFFDAWQSSDKRFRPRAAVGLQDLSREDYRRSECIIIVSVQALKGGGFTNATSREEEGHPVVRLDLQDVEGFKRMPLKTPSISPMIVVVDESHEEIKTFDKARLEHSRKIKTLSMSILLNMAVLSRSSDGSRRAHWLFSTGTPMPNGPADLINMVSLLQDGAGSPDIPQVVELEGLAADWKKVAKSRTDKGGQAHVAAAMSRVCNKLFELLDPFTLSRTNGSPVGRGVVRLRRPLAVAREYVCTVERQRAASPGHAGPARARPSVGGGPAGPVDDADIFILAGKSVEEQRRHLNGKLLHFRGSLRLSATIMPSLSAAGIQIPNSQALIDNECALLGLAKEPDANAIANRRKCTNFYSGLQCGEDEWATVLKKLLVALRAQSHGPGAAPQSRVRHVLVTAATATMSAAIATFVDNDKELRWTHRVFYVSARNDPALRNEIFRDLGTIARDAETPPPSPTRLTYVIVTKPSLCCTGINTLTWTSALVIVGELVNTAEMQQLVARQNRQGQESTVQVFHIRSNHKVHTEIRAWVEQYFDTLHGAGDT